MHNNIGKLFETFPISFFRVLTEFLPEKRKTYSKMSLRSESHLGDVVVSVSKRPEEVKPVVKTANEVSGYQSVLKPFQAVRESLDPIDPNVRNKTWMSQDLSAYANNEYVFATFPIALALFWDKGGGEI